MELLTLDEVAQLLRLSPPTVYRLAARGDIPGRKVGRHWRFIKDDLVRYLRNQPEDRLSGCIGQPDPACETPGPK